MTYDLAYTGVIFVTAGCVLDRGGVGELPRPYHFNADEIELRVSC
jgi:hypothetical protein